jgi:hypothetical protein
MRLTHRWCGIEQETTMTAGLKFPSVYHVATDRVLSIEPGRSARLHVLRGRIWLTEEGGGSDLILEAGDQIALAPHRTAVVQALRAANLRLTRDAESALAAPLRAVGGSLTRAWRAGGDVRQRLQLTPQVTPTFAP